MQISVIILNFEIEIGKILQNLKIRGFNHIPDVDTFLVFWIFKKMKMGFMRVVDCRVVGVRAAGRGHSKFREGQKKCRFLV